MNEDVSDNSDEEIPVEDEVVQEMDVFVSKSSAHEFFLLQFPLMFRNLECCGSLSDAALFKPNQHKLQLQLDFDVTSENFDRARSEAIAQSCSSPTSSLSPGNRPFEKNLMMTSIKLASAEEAGLNNGCFAVGFCCDGELHLTKLSSVLQMRPVLHYLNAAWKKTQQSTSNAEEGSGYEDEMEETPSTTVETVHLKFEKVESEAVKKRRESSFLFQQMQKDQEPWCELEIRHDADLRQLLTKKMNRAATLFKADAEAWLRSLVPETKQTHSYAPVSTLTMSLEQLRRLPLEKQVSTLMLRARVLRFSKLWSLLSASESDTDEVLRLLERCAVLVRGNWVVKSELLYPSAGWSKSQGGVPPELLCRVRDLILSKLDAGEFDATYCILTGGLPKIPSDDLCDVLERLAIHQRRAGWRFVLHEDRNFIDRFPAVVAKQKAALRARREDLEKVAAPAASVPARSKRGPSRRNRSMSKSQSSDAAAEDMKPIANTSAKIATTGRRRVTRKRAAADEAADTSQSSNSDAGIPNRLESGSGGVAQLATRLKSVKTEESDDDRRESVVMAELRTFLTDITTKRFVLSLADIRRFLLLKLAESEPGDVLSSGVTNFSIEQTAISLGARRYVGKKISDPIFIFCGSGSTWPEVRRVVADVLAERGKFRMATLKQCFLDKHVTMPDDVELRRLLTQYCTNKNGRFYLLGT